MKALTKGRVSAVDEEGVGYGIEVTFTTLP